MILSVLSIIWNLLVSLRRDILGIIFFARLKHLFKKADKENLVTADFFRMNLRRTPNKTCIEFYDKKWTFQDMEAYSNQIANLFSNKFRLKKGDCVALFMTNCPEYVGIWLGLSKIGVIPALINSNLKHQPLRHCIAVARAQLLIYNTSLQASVATVLNDLDPDIRLIANTDCDPASTKPLPLALVLESTLSYVSDQVEYVLDSPIQPNDTIMYVYTSGTTGLPKPAVIKQSRFFGAAYGMSLFGSVSASDRVFVTLPIYHGNGFFIGIGAAIVGGATCVLRKKFSASSFLKEVIETESTGFVYVGEICRFLISQPESPLERAHKLRFCIGNGLRKSVWQEFHRRFGVRCMEFYGATEGNCTMLNITSHIGSCGFVPLLQYVKQLSPICLIKIDDEMNPIRDKNGFCIECQRGEKGLLIGLISSLPTAAYNGYANNEKASSTKVLQDVFRKGQTAFNSGDLMVCDVYGNFVFCDRLGDTFRWRGENVATVEVENVISGGFRSVEVVVYGVEVAGEEGKCGMAAVKCNEGSDFGVERLGEYLVQNLAGFARPVFVRLVERLDYTGTFKIQKTRLVQEAYDLRTVKDRVFYLESRTQVYKELTAEVCERIRTGSFRI